MVNKPGHITTGNVLEDLGFTPLEIREMMIKHDLWAPIRAEIEARKLTQAQLSKVLEIHQPDASLLRRGQIERFSITRLLQFADRLGLAVTLAVAPKAETQRARNSARIPLRKPSQRKSPPRSESSRRTTQTSALA
jgi:predicted XRE-type DNA-binding protein